MGSRLSTTIAAFSSWFLVACMGGADQGPAKVLDTPQVAHDHAAVHGMLLVGTGAGSGTVYLSHLPLFHPPHDWQMLLEAEMVKPNTDALATYANDRQVTGEKVYTIVPEPFILSDLVTSPNGVQPLRSSFRATVVRGHFERGGSPFMNDVTFKIKRVISAKQLKGENPALPRLTYLLFGNELELFGAHVIQSKPDFDHVVSLRVIGGVLDAAQAAQIRQGVTLTVPEDNNAESAFAVGEHPEGDTVLGKSPAHLTLDVVDSFYLETGDLSF